MPVHITMKHCPLSNLWSGCNLSEWTFTSCCLQLAFVTRAYQEKSSSSYSFCCCGDDMLPPYNFPLPYSLDSNSLLSPADHVGAQVILLVLVLLPSAVPVLITPRQDYTLCCLHPDTVCSTSSPAVLHHNYQKRMFFFLQEINKIP